MALFKAYKGNSAQLPTTIHPGYVYLTTNDGFLYVDIDEITRVKVNADKATALIQEDGTVILPDEVVTTSDIIPIENGGTGNTIGEAQSAKKLSTARTIQTDLASESTASFNGEANITLGVTGILSIDHGGTGASSASVARTNLDVYDKSTVDDKANKATTRAYTTTLTAAEWTASGSKFTQTYSQTALTCGADANVPPMIMWTSNQDEYNYIESATANPGTGITFIATRKPTTNIGIVVVDNK